MMENKEIDEFEQSIAAMEGVDEFSEGSLDYEKFIVLSKKDLTNFCRIVEPLTKVTINEYGKSVLIRPLDVNTVELCYVNDPYSTFVRVPNKSGKMMKPFAVSVANLKKITTNAYASLVLVEGKDEIDISICGSLLFLETKPLEAKVYDEVQETCKDPLDMQAALYAFKKVGSVLSCSDRASEKVIVVKNDNCYYNTGFFAAKIKSPFGKSTDFILYKAVSDILGVVAELAKTAVNFKIKDEMLYVIADGYIYCKLPLGPSKKVDEFYSPNIESILSFKADIVVMNDSFLRLVSLVKALDYLSSIVSIQFTDKVMKFIIYSSAMTNESVYELPLVEGKADSSDVMKQNVDVLKMFLDCTGVDVKYSFNENGLGINNNFGSFLIRKN